MTVFMPSATEKSQRCDEMEFFEVKQNKKEYLDLLLLGDEQEDMIDRYLDRGRLFVLMDGQTPVSTCVVTVEGEGLLEVKNLAVDPKRQKQGNGRKMLELVADFFRGQYKTIQLGTGESPLTLPFYEKCGFVQSHRIKNFYTDNYDHPIIEAGVQLVDMVYLKKDI